MRSVEARFKKSENKDPFLGASIHLVRSVRGQKFSRKVLVKNFKKLVPKEEYAKDETKALVDFLEEATNEVEESQKQPIFALKSFKYSTCVI